MDKINWINGQAGGTPLSAENLNLMQTYIENAINEASAKFSGTVLYNNVEGTMSDFLLSNNSENYDYCDIFFGRKGSSYNEYNCVRVFNPNNKVVALSLNHVADYDIVTQICSSRIAIQGNLISRLKNLTITIDNTTISSQETNSSINIFKVVGYNY